MPIISGEPAGIMELIYFFLTVGGLLIFIYFIMHIGDYLRQKRLRKT